MHNKTIFLFTRDLRLDDNTGLIEALKNSKEVIPVFIINPNQIKNNEYKSDNALQFMQHCLEDLDQQLNHKNSRLNVFYGDPAQVFANLIKNTKIDAIYTNKDYTPFSKKRETSLKNICIKNKIEFKSFHDYVMHAPEEILTKTGTPYTIFTYYHIAAIQKDVNKPSINKYKNYSKRGLSGADYSNIEKLNEFHTQNPSIKLKGGRKEAIQIISDIKTYSNYNQERDFPSKDKTTHLSAHLKFGTISIRETHHEIKQKLGITHPLIRQLYWRDFFYQIAHHFPKVFGNSFQKKYEHIKWKHDKNKFEAWKQGKTGFPIIDAAMRELNQTGYMHNRARMIVASFLTKDLHIDWREGEKYFATKLIDYDPCINNGNWQWAASTGCDAQPYFRIFNPWLQQKKFDENAEYIKKWVPELNDLNAAEIHTIYKLDLKKYPKPIVDHSKEKEITLKYFRIKN